MYIHRAYMYLKERHLSIFLPPASTRPHRKPSVATSLMLYYMCDSYTSDNQHCSVITDKRQSTISVHVRMWRVTLYWLSYWIESQWLTVCDCTSVSLVSAPAFTQTVWKIGYHFHASLRPWQQWVEVNPKILYCCVETKKGRQERDRERISEWT